MAEGRNTSDAEANLTALRANRVKALRKMPSVLMDVLAYELFNVANRGRNTSHTDLYMTRTRPNDL